MSWRAEYPHLAGLVDRFWHLADTVTLMIITTVLLTGGGLMLGFNGRPWAMYANGMIYGARHLAPLFTPCTYQLCPRRAGRKEA